MSRKGERDKSNIFASRSDIPIAAAYFPPSRIDRRKKKRPALLVEERGDKIETEPAGFSFFPPPPAPHSLAYLGDLVHVIIHAGLAVPHTGVVPIDGGVVATLDG